MFPRTKKIEELLRWKDLDVIKVLTGVRRCGRSTLLSMVRDALVSSGVPRQNVVYLDFESREGARLDDAATVWRVLDNAKSAPGRRTFFLTRCSESTDSRSWWMRFMRTRLSTCS